VPTLTTVCHIVEHEYGIPVTRAVLVRSFSNDVYRVDTVQRPYALKVYGAGRWTADEVRWEQQLVRHLTKSGLAVADVVQLRTGDTVGVLDAPEGERPFAMGWWVPGEKPRPPWTEDLFRDVGTLLAGFHAAADTFRSNYPRHTVRTGEEIREVIGVLEHDPARRRLVQQTGAEAERQLTRLAGQGLRWGLRHGDPSLDNVHVSDAGLNLYDFDLAGPGWQVEDLAGALSTPFADAFLAGYTAVRPLSPVELEALPWLRIIATIENLRFHLIGKPEAQGTHTLTEGWVDRGFDSLAAVADEV
jgi:Ser/Thr protein kinase RdoA (MazF antagonist)